MCKEIRIGKMSHPPMFHSGTKDHSLKVAEVEKDQKFASAWIRRGASNLLIQMDMPLKKTKACLHILIALDGIKNRLLNKFHQRGLPTALSLQPYRDVGRCWA